MNKSIITSLAVAASLALLATSMSAASPSIWNGGGANNLWTTALNWTGSNTPVPSTTYDLQFGGTTNVSTGNNFAAASNFRTITFNAGAGAFTLAGNSITLNGNIVNSSTNLQTITLNLATTAVRTFTMTTGGGNTTVGVSGDTTKGVISGTGGGVTTAGTGVLTLWGNNTYTGNTTLAASTQTLNINSSTAIGAGTLVVGGNGTFDNTSSGAITLTNNNGLTLSGGSPTFTGTNDLSFGTGAVLLSGIASGSNRTITVTNANATLTLNGVVTANGTAGTTNLGITKAGAGTLVLGGSSVAAGSFRVNTGTLSVSNVGNTGGNSNLGTNGTFNFGGGTLKYTGGGETSDKVLNLVATTAGGTIDQSGSGNIKFTSNLTATGAGNKTLSLQGSTAGTGEIGGAIVDNLTGTNNTSVTKTGTGTWTFSGGTANTYIGLTSANDGELDLNKTAGVDAVGGGGLVVGDATGPANSAIVKLLASDQINDASIVTVNSDGKFDIGANSDSVGPVTLAGGSITGSGGTLTGSSYGVQSGSISANLGGGGTVTLTKSTAGTVILTGANSYAGGTNVNAGTLALNASNVLPISGTVSIGGGATLQLNGTQQGTTATAGAGPLSLASSAIIDLASTDILHFAASGSQGWSGTLSIYNWNGAPTTGGGLEQILFGTDTSAASLTSAQLASINFYSDAGSTLLGGGGASFASANDGEIVPTFSVTPVPEPGTWAAGAMLAASLLVSQRRRFARASR